MKAKNEIFNKLYLLYFISLPLVFSKSIIDPVLVPRQIHLGFFCIVTLAFMYFTKGENNEFTFKKEFKYLPIALLIFGGINLISITQANVLSEAYFVVSRISTTILFFFITIILLIRNQLLVDTLFKGVFCFATISLLIAGYQIIYNDDLNLISSTMANKNLLSSALFLCLPFLMIYKNEWKNYKYVQYSLITLLLIVLFYIRTRAVIIPLIIGGAIYLANKIYHVVKLKNRTRLSFFVVVGILCLLFSLFYINHNTSLGSFTDSNTFNTRVKLWHNTKYIIADNTLLGVGPGNWKFKFANYGIGNLLKEASDGRMIYQQPHNDFLEFFADSGLLAFLGYIALYVITAFYLMQLYKSANLNEDKEKYFIFLIALLGFAFISFFDFPMERVEHQVLFFTLLAVVLYYFSSLKDSQNLLNINFKTRYLFVLIFAGVFTAAVSIYIGTKRYEGEKQTVQIFNAHNRQDWTNLIKLVDETTNLYYETDPMSIPLTWYKGVAQFSMNNFQDAKETFENAFKIAPYNIHVLNNLASTYEKLGLHELAIKYYLESIRISPDFEESILNLSAVYFNTNNINKAYETIDKCSFTSQDPKYTVFLKAILRQWLTQSNNDNIRQSITNITDDEIMNVYILSKQKNTTFTLDIINYRKP